MASRKSAKKTNTKPRKRGRPTRFTKAMADKICLRMASGMSLREICNRDDMPHESTVRLWAVEDREGFSTQYAQACEQRAYLLAEEILEIADDATNDWMARTGKDGQDLGWMANGEHIQRSKLRVDTRKWLLSKLLPKQYGDRFAMEHSGPDGGAIPLENLTDEQLRDRLINLLGLTK